MENKLKPCPFCGGKARHFECLEYVVKCLDCDAEGPIRETVEAAIEAWNRRAGGEK